MKNARVLYFNGKVVTVDSKDTIAEAFVVEGNKFAAVGSNRDLAAAFGSGDKIDLKGACVVPGLNDGHAHPLMAGLGEWKEEIPVLKSVGEILDWIRLETREKGPGEWIYLHRCFPSRLSEGRWPTREELDRVAPDRPVFLNGAWAGLANTRALEESGIGPSTRHEGVVLGPDRKPNGVLHRSAHSLLKIQTLLSENFTPSEQEQCLRRMLSRYNRFGITSVTDTIFKPAHWALLSGLARAGALTARLHVNAWLPAVKDRATAEAAVRSLPARTGEGDEWLRMGPFKVAVDGGIFTCTAYLEEPWPKPERDLYGSGRDGYKGVCTFTLDKLVEVVDAAFDAGFTFTAHCTGDGASLLLMRAYERVNARRAVAGKRFQLLHGNFFCPAVIEKAKALGVLMDLQGAWLYRDLDALFSMLGQKRVVYFHPYRTLWDAGLVVCGGSDHMVKNDPDLAVNPYNPFIGMYAMTERTTDRGTRFMPEQALTRLEALKAYTVNNAYKSGEEPLKGSIEEGRLADFALLDKDILACSGEELLGMKVKRTVLGGRTVFPSGGGGRDE